MHAYILTFNRGCGSIAVSSVVPFPFARQDLRLPASKRQNEFEGFFVEVEMQHRRSLAHSRLRDVEQEGRRLTLAKHPAMRRCSPPKPRVDAIRDLKHGSTHRIRLGAAARQFARHREPAVETEVLFLALVAPSHGHCGRRTPGFR